MDRDTPSRARRLQAGAALRPQPGSHRSIAAAGHHLEQDTRCRLPILAPSLFSLHPSVFFHGSFLRPLLFFFCSGNHAALEPCLPTPSCSCSRTTRRSWSPAASRHGRRWEMPPQLAGAPRPRRRIAPPLPCLTHLFPCLVCLLFIEETTNARPRALTAPPQVGHVSPTPPGTPRPQEPADPP